VRWLKAIRPDWRMSGEPQDAINEGGVEVSFLKASSADIGTSEVRATEVGEVEVGRGEVDESKIGVSQVSVRKVRVGEVGAPEACAPQIGPRKVSRGKIPPGKSCESEVKSSEGSVWMFVTSGLRCCFNDEPLVFADGWLVLCVEGVPEVGHPKDEDCAEDDGHQRAGPSPHPSRRWVALREIVYLNWLPRHASESKKQP
jgi:hypothetical protein